MSGQEIKNFVEQFPKHIQNPVFALLTGQIATVNAYEGYESVHPKPEDSPTQGQHPHFAYAGDSNPESATKFGIGSGLLGETLVYRVPGGMWTEEKNTLTTRAQAYLELVSMKHIDHVVMATNSASEVVGVLAKAAIHGLDTLDLPPALRKLAEKKAYLGEQVKMNGWSHYESCGFRISGSPEQKMRQAIAVEIGRENLAASKIPGAPKASLVVQCPESGSYYHTLDGQKFIAVPALGDNGKTTRYIDKLPKELANIGAMIVNGLSRLKAAKKETNGLRASNISTSSCSDSRTPQSTLMGGLAPLVCHVLRTPGNIWTEKDGNLSNESALFLELASMRGDVVVKANEATCGAMTAIYDYNKDPDGKGKTFPEAFKKLGQDGQGLYDKVMKQGQSHYKDMGVAVRDPIASMALETLRCDVDAASRDPQNPPIVVVYQNIPERQNCVLHTERGEFLKIPSLPLPEPGLPSAKTKTTIAQRPSHG